MAQPKESNSKSHFYISVVKSGLRFGACFFLFNEEFGNSAITFALAEVLGIVEEL
jgi:hypothetical protein